MSGATQTGVYRSLAGFWGEVAYVGEAVMCSGGAKQGGALTLSSENLWGKAISCLQSEMSDDERELIPEEEMTGEL